MDERVREQRARVQWEVPMKITPSPSAVLRCLGAIVALTVTLLATDRASADIRNLNPRHDRIEIEPKLNLGYLFGGPYGGNGWGPGVRLSIPVMSPGFVKTINDSVAISFGLDVVRYSGNYGNWWYWCNRDPRDCPGWNYGYDAAFWTVQLPVTVQWNFWFNERWSAFAEPGLTFRQAFYPDYPWCEPPNWDPRFGGCYANRSQLYFTFYVGGRFHFSDSVALTMRIGHPIDFSLGVSFFL
jgi:hypothetical protein